MERRRVIDLVHQNAEAIRAQGVEAMYLFGSTAKGVATPESDVDIFIDYSEGFSLIDLAGLQLYLTDLFRTKADVTTRRALHPVLKDEILATAERIL